MKLNSSWRWRLVQWWVRKNLEWEGATPDTIQTALTYLAVAFHIQQLVKAGYDK